MQISASLYFYSGTIVTRATWTKLTSEKFIGKIQNKYTFQESRLWANQQLVKRQERYLKHKIQILIANVFQESKMFHETMFATLH